jgi:hypothetical protein
VSARRGLFCLAGALLAAAVLSAAASSLPTPPLSGRRQLEDWWVSNGTAVAAFSLVRVVGLALSGYVAALGLVGTIAATTRWSWADSLLARCATPAARRFLVGGGLVAGLSVSSVGAANTPTSFELVDIGPVDDSFELRDIGPVDDSFELRDIGPVDDSFEVRDIGPASRHHSPAVAAVTVEVAPPPAEPDAWVVAQGDHLWSIAAETMADRGEDDREATIAAYWLRLIEENRDVVGENPDLIHPGQVIRLPD